MAKHEFGIMPAPPQKGNRYDEYEPSKYNCISVDDELVEVLDKETLHIDFYHHTLDVKAKGLAYCGVTLIPPESLEKFIDIIKNNPMLCELKDLSETALNQKKWMIHFGL